jgi:hypothetical protein
MCIHCLGHLFPHLPPPPFPPILLPFTFNFLEHFYWYMTVIQRSLLWHFHIYIYCTPIWFIPSINLPLLPLPFSKWLWLVSVFHIHTCIESTSTIFTLLYSLSHYYHTLSMTCITFSSLIVLVSVHCLVGFCPGILPVSSAYFKMKYFFIKLFEFFICSWHEFSVR